MLEKHQSKVSKLELALKSQIGPKSHIGPKNCKDSKSRMGPKSQIHTDSIEDMDIKKPASRKENHVREQIIEASKKPDFNIEHIMEKYGIKKDHFVCFDEVVCKRIDPTFPEALIEMKNNVAALWIALGAKPVIGRFSMAAFTKSGFVCPEFIFFNIIAL